MRDDAHRPGPGEPIDPEEPIRMPSPADLVRLRECEQCQRATQAELAGKAPASELDALAVTVKSWCERSEEERQHRAAQEEREIEEKRLREEADRKDRDTRQSKLDERLSGIDSRLGCVDGKVQAIRVEMAAVKSALDERLVLQKGWLAFVQKWGPIIGIGILSALGVYKTTDTQQVVQQTVQEAFKALKDTGGTLPDSTPPSIRP